MTTIQFSIAKWTNVVDLAQFTGTYFCGCMAVTMALLYEFLLYFINLQLQVLSFVWLTFLMSRHVLGTGIQNDVVMHYESHDSYHLTLSKTADQKYIIINANTYISSEVILRSLFSLLQIWKYFHLGPCVGCRWYFFWEISSDFSKTRTCWILCWSPHVQWVLYINQCRRCN